MAGWIGPAALGFVVVALLSIVALPPLIARQSQPLYDRLVGTIAPARGLITQISHSLAIQGTMLRINATTDEVMPGQLAAAVAAERAATDSLSQLAPSLDSVQQAAFAEMRERQRVWSASGVLADPGPDDRDGRRAVFASLLDAVVRLDRALSLDGAASRLELMRLERLRSRVAGAMGGLALMASLIVGWIGLRMRRTATALRERQEAEDRAVEGRERLMRGVAHDLKNPLQAIDGHAQLIADGVHGPVTPEQRDSIARVRRSVQAMLGLITDLLELAQAEAGRLSIDRRRVNVSAVVRDVVEQFRPAAELTGHVLTGSVKAPLPEVRTDERRLRQIMGNLLSNAVKYTPAGGTIAVTGALRARGAGRNASTWLVVDVQDSGDGIPPAQRDAVFAEFTRRDLHRPIAGVGLGLAISRRIARLMGGDLTLAEGPRQGALFTLWLPLEAGAPGRLSPG